jgi:hypothetical protein
MKITFSREEVEEIILRYARSIVIYKGSRYTTPEQFNAIKSDSYMPLPSVTVWCETPEPTNEAQ